MTSTKDILRRLMAANCLLVRVSDNHHSTCSRIGVDGGDQLQAGEDAYDGADTIFNDLRMIACEVDKLMDGLNSVIESQIVLGKFLNEITSPTSEKSMDVVSTEPVGFRSKAPRTVLMENPSWQK